MEMEPSSMNRSTIIFSRIPFFAALSLLVLAIGGCGHHEPYDYIKVNGKVMYEDGSPIKVDRFYVKFISQEPATDSKNVARPGDGVVNGKTGEFPSVTSSPTMHGSGIVPGEHKVLILNAGSAVPVEYTRVETTPLTVNAKDSPFTLKIKKPAGL